MLSTANTNATVTSNATSTQKTTLMQRMMLKKMDKKIKNHVAPDETKAMNSNLRLGLIIGLVGLLIWILGGGIIQMRCGTTPCFPTACGTFSSMPMVAWLSTKMLWKTKAS